MINYLPHEESWEYFHIYISSIFRDSFRNLSVGEGRGGGGGLSARPFTYHFAGKGLVKCNKATCSADSAYFPQPLYNSCAVSPTSRGEPEQGTILHSTRPFPAMQ